MSNKRLYAVRGAVCTEDSPEAIENAVKILFEKLYSQNNIQDDDLISIQFTMTSDLKSLNPATALRKAGYGSSVPLFCSQEAEITGMLPKVIRVLITGYFDSKPIPVYANGAELLRPDLNK